MGAITATLWSFLKAGDEVITDQTLYGCTFAFFPWNWDRGDGCIVRLVAMIDKGQNFRIERGDAI